MSTHFPYQMPCVLVSCCGLPAAGKTSFCRAVTDFAADPTPGVTGFRVRVSHVCFDDYIDTCRRRSKEKSRRDSAQNAEKAEIASSGEGSDAGSKAECPIARQQAPCTECIEEFREDDDRPTWWREGRRDAMAAVEELARRVPTEMSDANEQVVEGVDDEFNAGASAMSVGRDVSQDEPCESGPALTLHVVLVDDNMHFRTMRHEVLCLARANGCGYVQVYFPTDVSVAITKDAARRASVSEAVILKMAAKLQPPEPSRISWERHTVVIGPVELQLNRRDDTLDGDVSIHDRDFVLKRPGVSAAMQSFWTIVTVAAADPVPPLSADSPLFLQQKESDREATKANALHRLDLELRETVKKVARNARSAGLASDTLRDVMNACTGCRKNTMRRARAAASTDCTAHCIGSVGHHADAQYRRTSAGSSETRNAEHTSRSMDARVASSSCLDELHCCSGRTKDGDNKDLCGNDLFENEFEVAVSAINGLDAFTRRKLVEVARQSLR